ncbi:MAG: hypothetical protein R2737_02695 [Candidatus Nanopelagicales bacterium]
MATNGTGARARRRVLAAVVALALGAAPLLAGCTSEEGTPATATASATGVAGGQPNGVAELEPDRILDLATKAALERTSVAITGDAPSGDGPVSLDLELVRDTGGQGTVSNAGQAIDVVVISPDAWISADREFWAATAGEAVADAIDGRWVQASTTDPDYAGVAGLADYQQVLKGLLSPAGDVAKGELGEVDGRPAIALTSSAGELWVATTGLPLPLQITRQDGQGTVTFADWDADVDLAPPPAADVVSADALPGGGLP